MESLNSNRDFDKRTMRLRSMLYPLLVTQAHHNSPNQCKNKSLPLTNTHTLGPPPQAERITVGEKLYQWKKAVYHAASLERLVNVLVSLLGKHGRNYSVRSHIYWQMAGSSLYYASQPTRQRHVILGLTHLLSLRQLVPEKSPHCDDA